METNPIPKVLLIEDDYTMVSLLATLLRYEGFNVAQLENDENLEAIMDTVRRENPAAILMDINLRQVNGFDLLKCIRNDETLKNTCVIMSSGMDFRHQCKMEGADEFLLKPFMPEELIQYIRSAVGNENMSKRE